MVNEELSDRLMELTGWEKCFLGGWRFVGKGKEPELPNTLEDLISLWPKEYRRYRVKTKSGECFWMAGLPQDAIPKIKVPDTGDEEQDTALLLIKVLESKK